MKRQTLTQKFLSTCAVASLLLLPSIALRAADVTKPGDPIVGSSANTPGAEGVANVIDNNVNSKYLNFDKLNTGFTVTPSSGSSIVRALSLVSANDSPERDPASYTLDGSNDGGTTWTPISAGAVAAFPARYTEQVIVFANSTAYTSYRLLFPTVANAGAANSMQIAEVGLLDGPPNRSIGANFLGRSAADGTVPPAALAGFNSSYAQRNWNTINQGDSPIGTSSALNNADGDWTPTTLQFTANDSWNNDGVSGFPNEKLMAGVIKAGNPAGTVDDFVFHNVPQGRYDLVIYADVNGDNVNVNFSAGATTFYITELHQFEFFRQAFNTVDPAIGGIRDSGNIVIFNEMEPDANGNLTFHMTWPGGPTGDGSGMAAAQLVSVEPKVFTVAGADLTHVRVTYNRPVSVSGADTDNYSIAGLTISGITLDASGTVALLTTSAQTPGATYTVKINNVTRLAAPFDPISPDTKASFRAIAPFDVAVNFTGGNTGVPLPPMPLGASEVAGVFPTYGWVNVGGNIGNTANEFFVPLNYTDGSASPVSISFTADEQWNSGTGSADPNHKLLDGYFGFSNGDNTTANIRPVYFNNVPEGHYSLVIYTLRDGSGEPESFTVNGDTANTLHVKSQGAADFTGTFVRGVSTDPNTRDLCNYVQFDNVQPVNGTITMDSRSETFRSPVDGMQLVYTDLLPIKITRQPVSTVSGSGAPFTFSVDAIGSGPRTITWFSNNVAIAGANSLTYTGTAADYLNGATFKVTVANGIPSSETSATVTLIVAPVPVLLGGSSLDSFSQICLRFSKPLAASALDASHYSVDHGVTVNSAAVAPSDSSVIILQTTTLTAGTTYTVSVADVTDTANPANTIFPNPSTATFTAGGYAPVRIESDRFDNIGGTAVTDLTGNANYPNNPTSTLYNPAFFEIPTNLGGSYGTRTFGLYVAPSSGNYRFAIATDDGSELWLSTDSNPAHKVRIAREETWNGARNFGTAARRTIDPATTYLRNQSGLIHLDAGVAYYMEALQKEGGGGDNMAVAVQLPPGTGAFTDGQAPIALDQFAPSATKFIYTAGGIAFTPGPVTLTLQPVSQEVLEGTTATFTIDTAGTPPYTIQWFSNNVAVVGATGKSFAIFATPPGNGAVIRAEVINLCSKAVSVDATLTVDIDLIKPTIADAGCDPVDKIVRVLFSEPVTSATATDVNNYSMDSGLTVDVATLLPDNKTVLLTLSDVLVPNQLYSLTVQNVKDRSITGNTMDAAELPIVGCICSPGNVLVQMYRGDSGANNFQTMTNNAKFPASPDLTALLASPNWPQTPNAIFTTGNEENYALLMKGFIIPTVSGNYRFSVHADDSGQLFVSSDSSVANLQNILYAAGDCGACGTPQSSVVTLNAGQAYYFECSFQEGGGGDYLELRWQPPNAAGFDFIPASNLRFCYDPLKTPLIITGPVSQEVAECRDVTFTAQVQAAGQGTVTYQWRRDGVDIPGATGLSYTLLNAQQSDSGASFTLHVSVLLREADSDIATLTVGPDLDVPLPIAAVGDALFHTITITFSELMDSFGAGDAAAYSIVGEDQSVINVSGNPVVLNGSNIVITTVEALTPGLLYTVAIGTDNSPLYDKCLINSVPTGTPISFHAWKFIPCLMTFQTYGQPGTQGGIAGNTVPDLIASPLFPNSPRDNKLIGGFDSRQGYPDDSHETYGGRMSGFVVPPFSGDFVFYLRSDDGGRLSMNTNNLADTTDPAGKVILTEETACCGQFSGHASPPITLNAGQRYYVEGLWKEGGGGDYLQIAAAPAGLTAAQADALAPMGPEFIGTIANPDAIVTLPTDTMIASGSYDPNTLSRGFDVHLVQVVTNIDNELSVAELLLAGLGGPNLSTQPYFAETDTINYNIDLASPAGALVPDRHFPGIPGATASTDNIAMEALTWVELTAGYHCMIVNSDDGFRLTPAMCAADPNNSIVLGFFNGGRGASDTGFVFNVPADGLYPMRLIWEQGGGGANVEWVDIQPAHVLIDGKARVGVNGDAQIRAFRLSAAASLKAVAGVGGVDISWIVGSAPCGGPFRLQGTATLANPSSATVWTDITGSGTAHVSNASGLQFFRLINP